MIWRIKAKSYSYEIDINISRKKPHWHPKKKFEVVLSEAASAGINDTRQQKTKACL